VIRDFEFKIKTQKIIRYYVDDLVTVAYIILGIIGYQILN